MLLNAFTSQSSSQQITFAAFNQQIYLLQLLGYIFFLAFSSAPFEPCKHALKAQHLQPSIPPSYHCQCPSNAPKSMVTPTLLARSGSDPRSLHRCHGFPHGLKSPLLGPLLLWPHLQLRLPSFLQATKNYSLLRLLPPSIYHSTSLPSQPHHHP